METAAFQVPSAHLEVLRHGVACMRELRRRCWKAQKAANLGGNLRVGRVVQLEALGALRGVGAPGPARLETAREA